MQAIKKVFIVYKTHLDIGFTDSAQSVLRRYEQVFIPGAIATARRMNTPGEHRFVWTVGSFLIDHCLKHMKDPLPLEQAISRGDIAWHGLPCTTHTELMNDALVRYALSISQSLDRRFGRTTIAAKMTDVPGHTQALIPYLAQAGIRYLHIGVNGSSKLPQVPRLCRWRYGNDEILLHYAGEYGEEDVFGDCALHFAHTLDNMGPPTAEDVQSVFARLREKYPQAQLIAGTLDDFAREILPYAQSLPVLECEIGDTWIHGVASDPYKTAALRELLRFAGKWCADEPGAERSAAYEAMMNQLLLICEHTWGRDSKRYLSDYTHWSKEAFERARAADRVCLEAARPAGDAVWNDCRKNHTGREAYSAMEDSWREQREYIHNAITAVPERLQEEICARLRSLRPTAPLAISDSEERAFSLAGYHLRIEPDGALTVLQTPGGACAPAMLGGIRYAVYGGDTVRRCYESYNRNRETTAHWSWPDFGKPGLERLKLEDRTWRYQVRAVDIAASDTLRIDLTAPLQACESYGAPRRIQLIYRLGNPIRLTLSFFSKDAIRVPEALYLHMNLAAGTQMCLKKLSQCVDPLNVCPGGNRHLHAVEAVHQGPHSVQTLHAPLCSIGGDYLYDVSDSQPDPMRGFSFILFNNRWGTNFPLYYEENASFAFHITLK